MTILIANPEEFALLTPSEAKLYKMFRLEGKTREEICEELKIGKETFRKHWRRATGKIRKYRSVQENPQYYLNKGQDILAGEVAVDLYPTAPAETFMSYVDDMREGTYVRIIRNFEFEDTETGKMEYMETRGMVGKIAEMRDGYAIVECEVYEGILTLSIPFNELELL